MDDRLRVEEDKFQLQGSLEPSVGRMYMRACFSEHICLKGGTSVTPHYLFPSPRLRKVPLFKFQKSTTSLESRVLVLGFYSGLLVGFDCMPLS